MASSATASRRCLLAHLVLATLIVVVRLPPAFGDVILPDTNVYTRSDIEVRYLSGWSRIGSGACGDDCAARYTNFTTPPPTINLLYVKLPKAASTTTAGVARRIALDKGLSNWNTGRNVEFFANQPTVWSGHMVRTEVDSKPVQLKFPTFVYSMVRDPVSRCLSLFYFKVTRGTATNTEEAKLDFVKEICRNNQYLYLRTNDTQDLEEEGRSDHEVVQHLLSQYSFMGVTEMYDESSVVLARLLGVPLTDVLYVSWKVAGSWQSPGGKPQTDDASEQTYVVHPELEHEDPSVLAYVKSAEWKEQNKMDYLLYDTSVQMLKQWIDANTMQPSIDLFKRMEARAKAKCGDEKAFLWYTNEAHAKRWCYYGDNGCAFPCLDAEFGRSTGASHTI